MISIKSESYFFLFLTIFAACHSENPELQKSSGTMDIEPDTQPSLNTAVTSEEYERLDADLFGDFYNNRVSFFISENPNVEIYGVLPQKAILYYIDEELFQKKYELPSDITHDLISVNGKFKIRGLNSRNDYFIRRLKSRILYGSEIVSLIDHYQLRWEKGDDEIIYQVRRDTLETSYTYIERVKGYKHLLKKVKTGISG